MGEVGGWGGYVCPWSDFQLLSFPILKGRPCPSARLVYIYVSVICYATISYVAEKCVIIGYT